MNLDLFPEAIPAYAAKQRKRKAPAPMRTLSKRQLQIIKGITAGKTNENLAQEFGISINTVKVHVWHVYQRLGVSSRSQCIIAARKLGLIKRIHLSTSTLVEIGKKAARLDPKADLVISLAYGKAIIDYINETPNPFCH